MRINRKILIAIIGFVFVAAGGLGLSKLGGFALIKEFFSRNAAHQATAADVAKDLQPMKTAADVAKDVQPMKTAADVAKDVQAMKDETKLPKTLDDYTELVDIRADGQAVVFVHRLTFAANPSNAYEFLAAVRTDMLQRACSNKGMPKAMNEGVVFRYQYADSVGFNVGSFDIGGNDCAGA